MKVILVDDDPTMHLILRKMLVKIPEVQVAGAFTNTKSAADFLSESIDIGLAFVDISMPEESGMAFAAKMGSSGSLVQLVFVTSHKEFALEAYELSVTDYLVKPVSQERLERAVNKVLAIHKVLQSPVSEAAESSGRLVITAFGDVSVSNEASRIKWISRKCAELFAYLLLHRGKRIPRSRLVADIFGGMHQTSADKYLNTTVYQLRKSLEPLGLREAILSENDGYTLELKDPVIDYAEFEKQTMMLSVIEGGNVEAAQQIERLYTGDLFGDKAYVWAIYETERYAKLYASFVVRVAAALITLRDTNAASKLLLKLNERNPLDESVIHHLMVIREMTGDKKGLTAVYGDYVRLLNRELGIRPSEELIHLNDLLMSRLTDKKNIIVR
ncbi:response regulator [Paenibacillus psychroresistens]|uniref:Response regulator n=1 Tax=Paenibacillus psychroresistens TaxID=1778678 RepID=A0A6B8RNW4_9BACL|nr:response regulator [Paenibacillus psychroresistens]QGQ97537.1 response regulator [Paenibacillus psychroresistens]